MIAAREGHKKARVVSASDMCNASDPFPTTEGFASWSMVFYQLGGVTAFFFVKTLAWKVISQKVSTNGESLNTVTALNPVYFCWMSISILGFTQLHGHEISWQSPAIAPLWITTSDLKLQIPLLLRLVASFSGILQTAEDLGVSAIIRAPEKISEKSLSRFQFVNAGSYYSFWRASIFPIRMGFFQLQAAQFFDLRNLRRSLRLWSRPELISPCRTWMVRQLLTWHRRRPRGKLMSLTSGDLVDLFVILTHLAANSGICPVFC